MGCSTGPRHEEVKATAISQRRPRDPNVESKSSGRKLPQGTLNQDGCAFHYLHSRALLPDFDTSQRVHHSRGPSRIYMRASLLSVASLPSSSQGPTDVVFFLVVPPFHCAVIALFFEPNKHTIEISLSWQRNDHDEQGLTQPTPPPALSHNDPANLINIR